MTIIKVENDGQRIASTNYWDTPNAKAGYAYMSINAGAYRLLIPPSQEEWVKDMVTASEVVITRGPWMAQGKRDAYELLFDDHSDSPFALHMVAEQWERNPSDADLGWKGIMVIYTAKGPAATFGRVYYRKGAIPCLKPAPRG